MSRQLRLQFPGATYHVMSRGNNREPIVHDEHDVRAFLDGLEATCERYAWRLFGWCIMPNHYHMVVETTRPTLSLGMRRHNSTYAQFFNCRHKRVGHVFQGRFKALVIADEQYLVTVLRYVELNPCRVALVQHPAEWPWSSVRVSLGLKPAPSWSAVREIWSRFSASETEGISQYREFLLDGVRSAPPDLPIHSSLVVGDASAASAIHERVVRQGASIEIPKNQRSTLPALSELFSSQRDIDSAIQEAYAAGHSLRAIAEYLGMHYSTVSVIARRRTPRKRGSNTMLRAAEKLLGTDVTG